MQYITTAERIGRQIGIEQGLQQGRVEGRMEGRVEGEVEGEQKVLLRLILRKFHTLPEAYRERLAKADAQTLLEWADRVLDATRLEDIFETSHESHSA